MPSSKYPFAIRFIGFPPEEINYIDGLFTSLSNRIHGYFRLDEDNLRDPDIFLANATEAKALSALSYLGPTDLRPALLVGASNQALPYPRLARPIDPMRLMAALDMLVEKRADELSRLEASDVITVPERRRRVRTTDPSDTTDYAHLRRPQIDGGILIVDKTPQFCEYVARLASRNNVEVNWVNQESEALGSCKRQKVSLVIINTSVPGVDAYRLCEKIKSEIADRVTVVFLVGNSFAYEQQRAREAGCDGYLNKPLSGNHVVSILKKFLPSFNRL